MKPLIALSLVALGLAACDRQKSQQPPVDEQTRTTSAVIVEPTLHDGHAAEPTNARETRDGG